MASLTKEQKEILNSLYRTTQQPSPKRKAQDEVISTLQQNEELIDQMGKIMMRRVALLEAIGSLSVKKVEAALANCDKDLAMVLGKPIHLKDKTVTFLLYPLYFTDDGKGLTQEDLRNIKEITELLWDKASHDVRDLWLKDQQEKDIKALNPFHLNNAFSNIHDLYLKDKRAPENQDSSIIKFLKDEQQRYAEVGGEKWLEAFIQKVKDYIEKVKSVSKRCCDALIDCCTSPVKKSKITKEMYCNF